MNENQIKAKVNGQEVYAAELDQEVRRMMMQLKDSVPPEQLPLFQSKMEEQALENLINQRLLLQKAISENIEPDAGIIDQRLEQFKGQFPSEDVYQEQITSWGVTEDRIREDIVSNVRITTVLDQNVQELPEISDTDIQSFYEGNPDNFQTPERVQASHILITSTPDEAQPVRAEKRLRLAGIRGELARGSDFGKLAGINSDCPSKEKGGDLGFFGKGQMVPAFEEVAFSMEPGEVSDIVETQFGYHLIQVAEHQKSSKVDLDDDVKGQIEKYLRQDKENQIVGAFIESLRKEAEIEYIEDK